MSDKDLDLKQKALKYKEETDDNDIDTVYRYGLMLYNGVTANKEEAARCFKMAADEGNIEAMYNYGRMLYNGDGVVVNKEEAVRYYKMAADGKNKKAMFDYAMMLHNGKGVAVNKEEAAKYFKMAADEGEVEAMYIYGWMLRNGEGVIMNKEEAARYFKKATDKKNIKAMYNYGIMLYNGDGVAVNKEEAVRYFQKVTDKGNIEAMYNYSVMLYSGEGIAMNKKKAAKYFKIAADKGQINAMYNYGLMLYNGEVVAVNKEEAARYFKMAADKGNIEAIYNYGVMLYNGEGVVVNKEEAVRYFNMAAAKGNVKAKKLLANINKNPTEVEQVEIENNIINTLKTNFINEFGLINFLNSEGYKNPMILGKGGFGKVYEMEKDGESYAVKIPNKGIKGNTKTPEQLKKDEELQTLIDLSGGGHTKKIDGFNIKQEGEEGVYQIEILKLREKNDLRKILKSTNNNINNISKFSLISQLAVAYKKLHSNGIVHRDIKPENVLFNIEDKRVKTADYGLSKIGKSHDGSGTTRYMAPEVINFKDKNILYIDEKSDVYSMGIMFLEILTGKIDLDLMELENPNFNSSNIDHYRNNKEINNVELRNLICQISLQDLFPSIDGKEEIIGEIREKLIELIIGMLEKDPKTRLSSNQVAEKCGEIFKICNLSKTELENCGIYDKDLYALGIFNEDTLEYQKNKIKEDLELLQKGSSTDPKKQTHLDTLNGKKELSVECKTCLRNLLECFIEEGGIDLNLDNKAFKENMERISKSGNQREYLLLVNKILDIKELKMSNEIFRLEEMENGMEEKRQIEEKKEELEKLKEERGLIMQEHIELSRLSNSSREESNDKRIKEELENLVKVSDTLSSLEKKREIEVN